LRAGLAERLVPQIEALQEAVEPETAERIAQSLSGEFEHLLEMRGAPRAEYRLVLPPAGEVGAVCVEDGDRTMANAGRVR